MNIKITLGYDIHPLNGVYLYFTWSCGKYGWYLHQTRLSTIFDLLIISAITYIMWAII
jgi:hypothetical protein